MVKKNLLPLAKPIKKMKKKIEFFTIGVYNSTEEGFFRKLQDNEINTFCDIRKRRGVRGSKYAYVNSKRLQSKLAGIGIKYAHILELAPTNEIRTLQVTADKQADVMKRKREELGEVFKLAYRNQILKKFDFDKFLKDLEIEDANRVVLFCVEESPLACHRSLVTDKLKEYENIHITHL